MAIGTLKVVQGDITKPQKQYEEEMIIIPHVCNNIGIMGAGVAYAIKKKWPKAEEQYKLLFKVFQNKKEILGQAEIVAVDNFVYVVNMVAQDGLIGYDNLKPIKYVALVKCMKTILHFVESFEAAPFQMEAIPPVIHCPKFGSDLAGGNWDFILELINEIWVDNGIDVVVYEYEK